MIRAQPRGRSALPILEIVGLVLIVMATIILVTQLAGFSGERQRIAPGLVIASVPVGGMPRAEAQAYVEQVYGSPVTIIYRDQEIRLSPDQIGLQVNSAAMLSKADEIATEGTFWSGFWNYLWARPENDYRIDLDAQYSPDLLKAWLADVASRYDRPPQQAQPVVGTLTFKPGLPGYTLDQVASLNLIDTALRRPTDRTVKLAITESPAPPPNLGTLRDLMIQYLASKGFQGVASAHVIDLATGNEMELDVDLRGGSPRYVNCDIPYGSTSTMKVAIMIDFLRHVGIPPSGSDLEKVLNETMLESGNASANAMMHDIGKGDPFKGALDVTDMVQSLGMKNSFIVVPYDDKTKKPADVYYSTPAREAARNGSCIDSKASYATETTVADLAAILHMLYQCAEFSGGGLMAAYPGEITQDQCRVTIELMKQNPDGIIMAGLPADIPIAHRHGWANDTHGDAGIVYTPGGDYILTAFLWADTAWLSPSVSFPLIQDVSAMTFNYFNPNLAAEPRRGFSADLNLNATPLPR